MFSSGFTLFHPASDNRKNVSFLGGGAFHGASFSVGLRLLVYFLFSRFPLDVLWAPFTILWVFACFLMDPLHYAVGFPLSPSLFYGFVPVF